MPIAAISSSAWIIAKRFLPVSRSDRYLRQCSSNASARLDEIHATTHSDPTYRVHDVIHYGVANMPGAVPRTSTFALTNTTFPLLEQLATDGPEKAVRLDVALASGANVWRGAVVSEGVAESQGIPFTPLQSLV